LPATDFFVLEPSKDTANALTFPGTRFAGSSLHQRDPRSALFEGYTGDANARRPVSASPSRGLGGYGYTGGSGSSSNGNLGVQGNSYRPATPNRR
jgi:blocked early in transport 1